MKLTKILKKLIEAKTEACLERDKTKDKLWSKKMQRKMLQEDIKICTLQQELNKLQPVQIHSTDMDPAVQAVIDCFQGPKQ